MPQGLIHDWLWRRFYPDTTIDNVFALLNDYGRYSEFYKPAVIDAKLIQDSGRNAKKFSLVLAQKVPFVTAAISSEYISKTVRLDDKHWRYTVTYEVHGYSKLTITESLDNPTNFPLTLALVLSGVSIPSKDSKRAMEECIRNWKQLR